MSTRHFMRALVLASCSVFGTAAHAGGIPYGQRFAWDPCFEQVGAYYKISPLLLRAIAWQESSMRPAAIGKNPNPSMASEYGIGLMQISNWHLPRLRAMGVTEEMLLSNTCLNITVGASILADNISRHGLTWEAVGRYNAKTDWKKRAYAAKIQRHLVGELQAAARVGSVPGPPAGRRVAGAQ